MKKIKDGIYVLLCSCCGTYFKVQTEFNIDPKKKCRDFYCMVYSIGLQQIENEFKLKKEKPLKDDYFNCEECEVKVNRMTDDNYLLCSECAERLLDQMECEMDEKTT